MRLFKATAALGLLLASACDELTGPAAVPEFRPGDATSLDRVMCLLGFVGIPLREVRTGHHLVEATVDGTTASFVLDTGANMTVIDNSHADHFGLSPRSGAIGALGAMGQGAGRAGQASVGSFAIGPVAIRQNRVVLADMAQLLNALGQAGGQEVVGVIGQDVLKEHRAMIDVARPMVYMIEENRDPAPVPPEQCDVEGAEAEPAT